MIERCQRSATIGNDLVQWFEDVVERTHDAFDELTKRCFKGSRDVEEERDHYLAVDGKVVLWSAGRRRDGANTTKNQSQRNDERQRSAPTGAQCDCVDVVSAVRREQRRGAKERPSTPKKVAVPIGGRGASLERQHRRQLSMLRADVDLEGDESGERTRGR